jgi:hypothetical protein
MAKSTTRSHHKFDAQWKAAFSNETTPGLVDVIIPKRA